jgi:hypothetical protein
VQLCKNRGGKTLRESPGVELVPAARDMGDNDRKETGENLKEKKLVNCDISVTTETIKTM